MIKLYNKKTTPKHFANAPKTLIQAVVRKSYHTPLWGHLIKGPQLFHFFDLRLENWYTYPPK